MLLALIQHQKHVDSQRENKGNDRETKHLVLCELVLSVLLMGSHSHTHTHGASEPA